MATCLRLASAPIGQLSPRTFNKRRMKRSPVMPKRNNAHFRLLKLHKKLAPKSVGEHSGRWTMRVLEGLAIIFAQHLSPFFIHKDELSLIEGIGPIQIRQIGCGP